MKKLFLALVCAGCTLTASAQYASDASTSFFSTEKADQPVTFGIRGGVNFAKQVYSADNLSETSSNKTGFNVGLSVDIPLMQSLYVQSGLYYTMKGYKIEEDGETWKANPGYLQIPILASYRFNINDAIQLQVNVGPYFACGISGKDKVEGEYWGESYEEEYDYFNDNFKRFDAGFIFGAGVTFGHIFVGMNYELGLSNNLKDSDISQKNRCFSINLGYNF